MRKEYLRPPHHQEETFSKTKMLLPRTSWPLLSLAFGVRGGTAAAGGRKNPKP